jgi:hypothetical protein
MLSAWSVLLAAFVVVATAAPSQYGQQLPKALDQQQQLPKSYNQQLPKAMDQQLPKTYDQQLPKAYGQQLLKTTAAAPVDLSNGFCLDKEDGAQGEGCENSYWLCWKGVATSQECPDNLWFNIENGQCDMWDNVFSCSGLQLTTPAEILSDNVPMAEVDFDCSHLEDGDYSFSYSSCQAKYVSCVAGAAWERMCPEGLSFDLENRVCMLIENIIACGGSAPSVPIPTEAPVLIISFDCPTPTGSFAVLSELCGSTYYNCQDNVATIAYCDEPMIWDDSNKLCRLAKEIPECSFDCSGKADSSFSDGCSPNYWWCWQEKATKLACPDNMVFDGERAMCDIEANVAECGGVATTPLIVSDNATPMPVDFDCTRVEDGQYAFLNGEVCQPKFVSCVGKIAWEMACPDGLMFDPDQMMCERIDAIVACGGTAEPMSTTTYSYTYRTTPLAEPTTKSYSSYQAPARKLAAPVSRIEKASYGSYQAPAVKLAAPVSRIEKASYGSYQAPAVKTTLKPRKAMLTTTPLADDDSVTLDYGFALASEPEMRNVYSSGYGSLEETAAEPTTRRSIKTTLAADQSYGSYQAPAAEPTTRRQIKTTRLAAPTTRASYGYQTTTPAFEPTTKSYGSYQAPARKLAAPVSRIEKASYGSYQAPAVKLAAPVSRIEKASYGSYQAPAVKLAAPVSHIQKASYGSYQAPAAEPITTRRHIKTTLAAEPVTESYGSYQAPAAEPITTRRHIKTTLAAEPTTKSYGSYQSLAAEPTTRLRSAYGSQKIFAAPTLKPVMKEQQPY